jgi:hypothetical protein
MVLISHLGEAIDSADQVLCDFAQYFNVSAERLLCAVFSLEPLAQDPRQREITDMRYVNLFTPLPLPCSAPSEAWKPSCGDHSVWII